MDVSLQLYHGDCLEVMKTIADKSIDLILCDLPYGCLSGRAIGKTAESKKCFSGDSYGCNWDVKIDLDAFWKEVKRIRRSDSSPCIHFCSSKFGYDLIKSNEKEFRYDLVYAKTNAVGFLTANRKPIASHEMIYVFSKVGSFYNRVDINGVFPTGGRCVTSVINVLNKKCKGGHPTEKPMELYRFLIERYCPLGGTVLDPTAGSGNSVFTAYDINRSGIAIEKNNAFYDKMVKRLDNYPTS